MSNITGKKPPRKAIGATPFRAIANKEYNLSKYGSGDLAENFLPFLLRLIIKFKRKNTYFELNPVKWVRGRHDNRNKI